MGILYLGIDICARGNMVDLSIISVSARKRHYSKRRQLVVDCDEYLVALRRDLCLNQLVEVFPGIKQWFLPWLMRPLVDDGDLAEGGFWGHVGKPLIHSADLDGVAHDHGFRLRQESQEAGQDSAPAGQFGLALVHFWSRSFRDCLLKTFNNRFRNPGNGHSSCGRRQHSSERRLDHSD